MKVKYANPDLPIRDPDTKRHPAVESDGTFTVPETNFWVRRVLSGELIRVDQAEPTGREPVAPLTTRSTR